MIKKDRPTFNKETGFEYFEDDDNLLRTDLVMAAYLEDDMSEDYGVFKWLAGLDKLNEEKLSAEAFAQCKSGDVLIAELVFQQDQSQAKLRPCVFICAAGRKALVFQITGKDPTGTERETFQYKIQSLDSIGCTKPSWINFDHYVMVDSSAIVNKIIGPLSDLDRQGLIDKMKVCQEKYADEPIGYHNHLKYDYNDFIKYLSR